MVAILVLTGLVWSSAQVLALVTALVICLCLSLLSLVQGRTPGAAVPSDAPAEVSSPAEAHARDVYLRALDSSLDALLGLDSEGRVVFANLEARRLFPSSDQILGKSLGWVLPNWEVREAVRASTDSGEKRDITIERPNHQQLRLIVAPLPPGSAWSCVLLLRDLAESQRVDLMRRDFVANVSHELRTPLASIKAVIETLRAGAVADQAAAADFLARADQEVDRLIRLVEQLLEISRIESGEAPPEGATAVDIASVVRQAAERLADQAQRQGVSITVQAQAGVPPVYGNDEKLERAVVNILHNAVKFTPVGGLVTAEVSAVDGDVAVRIRDTGVGIMPEDLPRIFERFYKADRVRQGGGAGLGLALVKHTVEAYGGRISVVSAPGKGSEFTITLPTREGAQREDPGAPSLA
jgi:two-component system phosphate regulon sensor histidine kinase PhoR